MECCFKISTGLQAGDYGRRLRAIRFNGFTPLKPLRRLLRGHHQVFTGLKPGANIKPITPSLHHSITPIP